MSNSLTIYHKLFENHIFKLASQKKINLGLV